MKFNLKVEQMSLVFGYPLTRILLAMKLTAIFLLFALVQVYGNGYSQNINIKEKNKPVANILELIEAQSKYSFLYNKGDLKDLKSLNIVLVNATIKEALEKCFRDLPLTYKIFEHTVVVKRKPTIPQVNVEVQQMRSLKGIIRSRTGEILPNVTVKNLRSGYLTASKQDGSFEVPEVNIKDELSFSLLGYAQHKLVVANYDEQIVVLSPQDRGLDEVVVVGYGTLRRKNITGSISRVDESTIKETPANTLENAIQGRMAGVVVTNTSAEPGGGININIRGITSISGTNQPLYVIDGVPMYNDNSRSSLEFEGNVSGNFLASLNPSDVVSVEVLKDAQSTAIYGSRGANGVIMITTKRGKPGKSSIEVGHYTMFSARPKLIKLANAKEYATFYNEMNRNDNIVESYTGKYLKTTDLLDSIYLPAVNELGEGTNWQKELTRPGITHNYQLSASGGNDIIRYLVSGNYLKDEGILRHSEYQKGSFRLNMDAKITPRLSAKVDMNVSSDLNNRAENSNSRILAGGFERSGVILKAFAANPTLSMDNQASQLAARLSTTPVGATFLNPLYDLSNTINQRRINYYFFNSDFNYKITDKLSFTVRGAYNTSDASTDQFWSNETQLGYLRGQKAFRTTWKSRAFLNENFLTYAKNTSTYSLNVVGGVSWQKSILNTSVIDAEGLPIPVEDGLNLLPLYTTIAPIQTNLVSDVLLSGYGRVSFSYLGKYSVNVVARSDGSSHFAKNKKWGFFPSAGLAWHLSDEEFFQPLKTAVSTARIRGSYGISGNQAIPAYGSLAQLYPLTFGFVNGVATGMITGTPSNVNLTWETTRQMDLGIELGFAKDKYKLSLAVYNKQTNDLLQSRKIPGESGYNTIPDNFGSIKNKGIEMEISTAPIVARNFSWNLSFNASANRNKISDLGDGIEFYNQTSGGADYTHRMVVGSAMGEFWGYKTAGLLTADDISNKYPVLGGFTKEGMLKFIDNDHNNIINDDDKESLGNAFPKWNFGLNNTFSYRNISLNVFVYAVMGQKILNQNLLYSSYGTPVGIPSKDYIDNHWTPENKNAYYPQASQFSGNSQTTDRLIEDGSFVRFKNITLRYNVQHLPKWLTKLQLYVTGNNLITITKYSGYDPEVSAYGQNILLPGIDLGSYPRTKMYTFGVNVEF